MELARKELVLNTAAGTARKVAIAPADSTIVWKVLRLAYLPNAAITADNTDYVTLRPYKGASTALAAARVTTVAGTGFTALTAEAITLTATGTDLEITRANPLNLSVTHSGSGKAVDMTLLVEFEEVRQ